MWHDRNLNNRIIVRVLKEVRLKFDAVKPNRASISTNRPLITIKLTKTQVTRKFDSSLMVT